MKTPFFSVVIPTHNRYELLKRAVASVLKQTYSNFELIIVDDHSQDETPKIGKVFSDKRINYKLNNRSKGACGARNTGIFSAKGEWVAFLDDDDVWLPQKLEYQYKEVKNANSSIGLICSDFVIFKGSGNKYKIVKNRPSGWVKTKIMYGGIGSLSSTCVKLCVLKKIKGFDESFPACQDKDLWYRVAEVSEFKSIPKVLVYSYQEKRNRISHDPKSKLYGHIMLRNKYAIKIDKDFCLKHRYESPIFMYGLIVKSKKNVINSMPWFFLGLIVDFPFCFKQYRTFLLLFYRYRKEIFLTPWN